MVHHWRCVLIGGESLLIQCATLLEERGHEIAAIVAQGEAVRDWAEARGTKVMDGVAALAQWQDGDIDYLFSITNLELLPQDVLTLARRAAINFHDGPLPYYAGLNTPVWALLNGEREHGVTWHMMTKGIDRGPILACRGIAIDDDETAFSLNTKCFSAGIESFEEMIDALAAGRCPPIPQPHGERRLYGRRNRPPAACAIQWNEPAEEIERLVRALDFGGYANPMGIAKASCNGTLLLVHSVSVEERASGAAPGTILRLVHDGMAVSTGTRDIVLRRISLPRGTALRPEDAARRFGLLPGMSFDLLADGDLCGLGEMHSALAAHEGHWLDRLRTIEALDLPLARMGTASSEETAYLDFPLEGPDAKTVLTAAIAYFGRIADKPRFDIGYDEPILTLRYDGLEDWFSPQIPFRADMNFSAGFGELREIVEEELREIHRRIGYSADLPARTPGLRQGEDRPLLPVAVMIADRLDLTVGRRDAELALVIRSDGCECRWLHDPARFDTAAIELMQDGISTLLRAACADLERPIGTLPLQEESRLCQGPVLPLPEDMCIHQMVSEQARRTPDQVAVTCRGISLSYAELDARSNQLARYLQSLGVGPDVLVGLFMHRSVDLIVALFGILKAGGAYVPLDPHYPKDRIHYMLDDCGAGIVLTESGLAASLPTGRAQAVRMDSDRTAIDACSPAPTESGAGPDDLAYVIYTSGSTGKPKGVMIEHRNVANFFAGIDQRIAAPGTWLAVTSLSFDISVLELAWTLSRGFHVVLATGEAFSHTAPAAKGRLDFSLFYFSADAASDPGERYRLLLEGAKYADANGFSAVWTPERHFHEFGGLYPNPAVTGAAIAAITNRIAIRGGSVVMPLHHPARVAEEWSVVDNLSNGRTGIAFASGWQPNDFVLRPQSYADRSTALMRGAEAVRALWRGDAQAFDGPLGQVEIRTLPRPVQAELPFWITSAGNRETFAAAGRSGAGVLTHLLGQTIEELAEKLAAYRMARKEAGHSGDGHVVLMLHSFVGPDAEKVKAAVREPMIAYLRTSTNLVKQYAWSFPAFKRRPGMEQASGEPDLASLSDAEMDMLLEHSFNRYFETSGLFGTPQTCLETAERVRAVGVDEIACLIDFGVEAGEVLAHLPYLNEVRQLALPAHAVAEAESLPALMVQHKVTHLQCTPSMMRLLLADDDAREPLARLKHVMVGGEAFPQQLAGELHELVQGTVTNMYGPTETTIWSAIHDLDGAAGAVPLGMPLANQQVYILDSRQQPLPAGVPGEIVIGGNGVVRGYLHRPELTAERFIADPVSLGHRAYRTGDLGRIRPDGVVEFLGRLDHQVKIRGYRIELGEIEAALSDHPGVKEAVVVSLEEEAGDVRLAAYVTPAQNGEALQAVRAFLQTRLPEFMVPAHITSLEKLPQTPNGKIDRKALPSPTKLATPAAPEPFIPPANDVEKHIADIWRDVLKLDRIGSKDNFFDLGGHSLLAVQMHRRIRADLSIDLPITDIFRFPTVESLSAHLSGASANNAAAAQQGQARAQERRMALLRRAARAPIALGEGS